MAHSLRFGCSSNSGGGLGSVGGVGGAGEGGTGGGDGGGSNSSGSRSKKVKEKKVPQRGLGVAQLERIRMEEQEKKEVALQAANVLANNAIGSPTDTSPGLTVPCPKFIRPSHSSNSLHMPPPSSTDLPSPNSFYRPSQPVPNMEAFLPNSVQVPKPLFSGGGEVGMPAVHGQGLGNWSRLWNRDQNLQGEKQRLDHHGFTFRPPVTVPFESNPVILSFPSFSQRSNPFHQPLASSMQLQVNAPPGISSSSVQTFPMEPPSNQNFRESNYVPLWPEEEKMVGIKRSYPFSQETPAAPSFHKFRPPYGSSISRSDESASCSNACTTDMEQRNKYLREGPSNSSPLPEQNPRQVIRESARLHGDFLTLATPRPASPSKDRNPMSFLGHERQASSELEFMPSKEITKDPIQVLGPSRSAEQPPFSFFPSKVQTGEETTDLDNGKGENEAPIDLSLKL